jgi:hypothetical protein
MERLLAPCGQPVSGAPVSAGVASALEVPAPTRGPASDAAPLPEGSPALSLALLAMAVLALVGEQGLRRANDDRVAEARP